MAKTSFKKVDTAPSAELPADEQETSVALAIRTPREVATYQPTDEFTGAWNRSDVRDPRINLIQKSSQTALHAFGLGSFVLNREIKLSDGKTPLQITVVASDKDFQQKLPWGSKDQADVVRTPEDVRQAGGTLVYKGAAPGTYYGPRAHQTILLKATAGLSEDDLAFFPYEFNGEKWSVTKMTVSSSGFTSMAKELATMCTYNKSMRQGMIYGQLALTSKEVPGSAGESWFIPQVSFIQENPRELLEFFESLRN